MVPSAARGMRWNSCASIVPVVPSAHWVRLREFGADDRAAADAEPGVETFVQVGAAQDGGAEVVAVVVDRVGVAGAASRCSGLYSCSQNVNGSSGSSRRHHAKCVVVSRECAITQVASWGVSPSM